MLSLVYDFVNYLCGYMRFALYIMGFIAGVSCSSFWHVDYSYYFTSSNPFWSGVNLLLLWVSQLFSCVS